MGNAFILHGAYGNPLENWIPWLKKELEGLNVKVFTPKFPTPEKQNLTSWLKIFEEYKNKVQHDTYLIGHSIAAGFILNILEKSRVKISASFLIAGWTGLLNHPVDKINRTFIDKSFDFEKIKTMCNRFYIFQSDNDPYVPVEKGKTLSRNLDTEMILVKNAGHFNEEAGYTKFDLLLEKIKSEMNI